MYYIDEEEINLCLTEFENDDLSNNFLNSYFRAIHWAAPEVLKDGIDGHSFASDIWSLGCIIIDMLTNCPPFFKHLQEINNINLNNNANYLLINTILNDTEIKEKIIN